MLMKLALEKDFKFQNWVDSVFYLCTPKLGDCIYSLGIWIKDKTIQTAFTFIEILTVVQFIISTNSDKKD